MGIYKIYNGDELNMNKKKNRINHILVFIMIAIVCTLAYFVSINQGSNVACYAQKYFNSLELEGVVINKFLDKENHLIKTLEVNSNSKIIRIFLTRDKSGLYEYILIGDSILKSNESLKCSIKRVDTTKEFIIDFGCQD